MRKFRIRLYPKYDLELAWRLRKVRFESCDEYRTCMRCGGQMRQRLAENALSRAMDVHVCPECGMDEALRDAYGDPLPVSEWHIVKHHYFGEHEDPNTFRLLPTCNFQQIYNGPKKTLPLSSLKYPVSLVAYSRSDYDGRQWWRNWFGRPEDKPSEELSQEIDAFQNALMKLPEFQTLRDMRRMCGLFAARTSEKTEFHLYSETDNFYVWLHLITRERDYNLYVHYYLKDS